ncbi:spermatogenesis-associated protein 9 [Microcaecilia unicolor]|uniref:Spermatogenesis-associated protein 9 n=1 Tax=Microcaecilia unicolor TaxID=1415580 RepID=A0A6P7X345_9AMPH|nr:spermatogenesis-associated protein 9 [Microcaecilia unicolor]
MPGQSQLLQRTAVDIIDEIKDEFPIIMQLPKTSQSKEPVLTTSKTVLATVLKSPKGTAVVSGLIGLSRITNSTARHLQPQLTNKFVELNSMSNSLLKTQNIHDRPFNILDRKGSLLQAVSFPAKTAFTSLLYALYAVLIYVTLYINLMVALMKNLTAEEKSSMGRNSDGLRSSRTISSPSATDARYYGSPLQKQTSSLGLRKACRDTSIQVIHSVFDGQAEETETGIKEVGKDKQEQIISTQTQ